MEAIELTRMMKTLIPGENVLHLTHTLLGTKLDIEAWKTGDKENFMIHGPGISVLTENLTVFDLPTGIGLITQGGGAMSIDAFQWDGELQKVKR